MAAKTPPSSMQGVKLVIGLGNPGAGYARNRHNVGFQCINLLARRHKLSFSQHRAKSRIATGSVLSVPVVLARPQTFMNNSGVAVKALLQSLRVDPKDILVIHDDLDLPLGKIRIRPRGGAAGHKGMRSIIQELGGEEFPRLKVGIGRPLEGVGWGRGEDAVVQYVLSDFSPAEEQVMVQARALVVEAIEGLLTQGLEAAMNCYNRDE